MTTKEVDAIARGIAPVVNALVAEAVGAALAPVLARLDAVERRAPEKGERGERGEKGDPGDRGEPGLSLTSADFARSTFDGERTVVLRFGDDVEIPIMFPIPIYRGVYDETKSYASADVVTFGGHVWIAKHETTARPSDLLTEGKSAWTLMAKRGRDGKPGRDLRGIDPVRVRA